MKLLKVICIHLQIFLFQNVHQIILSIQLKKNNLYIIKKLLLQKIWKEYQKIYQLYKKNFLEIFMIIQEYSILKININII